jgi:hypothetical protein
LAARRQQAERLAARALGLALDPSVSAAQASAELACMAQGAPDILGRARVLLRPYGGVCWSHGAREADYLLSEALFSVKVNLILTRLVMEGSEQ